MDAESAEIERLKEQNAHFAWRDKDKNRLITELADALDVMTQLLLIADVRLEWEEHTRRDNTKLIERAREAAHET